MDVMLLSFFSYFSGNMVVQIFSTWENKSASVKD